MRLRERLRRALRRRGWELGVGLLFVAALLYAILRADHVSYL